MGTALVYPPTLKEGIELAAFLLADEEIDDALACQQTRHQTSADEPCGAGDEVTHALSAPVIIRL